MKSTIIPAMFRRTVLALFVAAGGALSCQGQVAGVTTAAALNQRLKESLDKAVSDGDYLLGKALIDARTLLDAWQKKNEQLVNTTFDRLDKSQQKFLRGIQDAVAEANSGISANLEKVQATVDEVYQLASDSIFVKDRLAVLRYSPSILAYGPENPVVEIRVRGIGLIDAETQMTIGTTTKEPDSATMQEQVFFFPSSAFVPTASDKRFVTAKYVARKKSFWSKAEYTTNLVFKPVPANFAKYELTIRSHVEDRKYSGPISFTKEFKARKDTVRYVQRVTKGANWYIDPSTIKLQGIAGEASDGPVLDGVPTPAGFAFSVKCHEVKKVKWKKVDIGILKTKLKPEFFWTGGWQRVRWTWQEYTPVKKAVSRTISGELLYGKESLVELPEAETASVTGLITTTDGKQYVVDGLSRAGPVVVELLKDAKLLAFRAMRLE